MSNHFIDPDWLERVRGSIFYYPAAGKDTVEPIEVLHKSIQTFWFCDKNYETNLNLPKALTAESGFQIIRTIKNGAVGADFEKRTDNRGKMYDYLEPSRLIEEYQKDAQKLTVIRRRGFGQIALSQEFDDKSIGVFMHRGDTAAEGGSKCHFLANRKSSFKPCSHLFHKLESKLKDQALIISDGSNSSFKWLQTFHFRDATGKDAFLFHKNKSYQCKSFQWSCMGWLNMKYGPTLVWGLTRI